MKGEDDEITHLQHSQIHKSLQHPHPSSLHMHTHIYTHTQSSHCTVGQLSLSRYMTPFPSARPTLEDSLFVIFCVVISVKYVRFTFVYII